MKKTSSHKIISSRDKQSINKVEIRNQIRTVKIEFYLIHNFGACLYERISVLLNFSIIFFKRQDSKWPKLEEKAAIGRFQAIEELKNKQAQV